MIADASTASRDADGGKQHFARGDGMVAGRRIPAAPNLADKFGTRVHAHTVSMLLARRVSTGRAAVAAARR